ncbi:MAG: hypothetical protein ACM3ZS_05205 [Nitrososphaerota archaeon]
MTEQYSTDYDIKVSQRKPFDRTVAFWNEELIATWLLNHEQDLNERQADQVRSQGDNAS